VTGWAMISNMVQFYQKANWSLFSIGIIIVLLEEWMIVESVVVLKK
jgi:carbon starvation protein